MTSLVAAPLPHALAALSLVACGASVRGGDAPARDAGLADAQLGPIEGCPSRTGTPRGRWESLALPDGFSARAGAALVAADRSLVILGGAGERSVARDNWRIDAVDGRWQRPAWRW